MLLSFKDLKSAVEPRPIGDEGSRYNDMPYELHPAIALLRRSGARQFGLPRLGLSDMDAFYASAEQRDG